MSTRTRSRTTPAKRQSARRRVVRRRRRIGAVLAAAVLTGLVTTLVAPVFEDVVVEVTLPLRHEDIIRQQARDKDLDPALIAAVIYAESRFIEGRTSSAGAEGLMQVTPATAKDIARRSGATTFVVEDLDTPQVNISYGSFHLRYLLDRFGDNVELALAAYNGGEGNVDRWLVEHRSQGRELGVEDIPFPETREYVGKVLDARVEYRRQYRDELGL